MSDPSYEETLELLMAPWREAMVTHHGLYYLGERKAPGAVVLARAYHNDPDGWVSIRVRLESGEPFEFTESADRVKYLDEIEVLDLDWDRLAKLVSGLLGESLMLLAGEMEEPEEDIILNAVINQVEDLREEFLS